MLGLFLFYYLFIKKIYYNIYDKSKYYGWKWKIYKYRVPL